MNVSPTRWWWIYFDVLKNRSSLCSCLKPCEPVKTTVWIKLEAAAVMPSLCVYLRRGILRRYRQVPRTEADGAFNYSRAVNRRGLLNSGRTDVKPSIRSFTALFEFSLFCVASVEKVLSFLSPQLLAWL